MIPSFQLIWLSGTAVADGMVTFPVVFPGVTTPAQSLGLYTSAASNLTFETLTDVSFYLTGSDAPMVQGQWPYLTDALGVCRPEVTGGFEISFDGGFTWTRFTKDIGLRSNPDTWLALPQEAVGSAGTAGQIGAFDVARLLARYVIPPSVSLTKVLDLQLVIDCDVS